jgi:hypothetical protein
VSATLGETLATHLLTLLPSHHESLLADSYQAVLDQVKAACAHVDRDPASVQLVAVTKTVMPAVARSLARLGAIHLGENRLPSFDEKLKSFGEDQSGPPVRWHFIGQLQRNKARRVVERADIIHSVTSVKLLQAIGRIAGELDRKPGIYLQVKHAALDDDQAKAGLTAKQVPEAVDIAAQLASEGKLELLGLMTMGPLGSALSKHEKSEMASAAFCENAALAANLPHSLFHQETVRLSMGMSDDLNQAIAAGSTCVRIGSALFRGLPDTYRIAPLIQAGTKTHLDAGGSL